VLTKCISKKKNSMSYSSFDHDRHVWNRLNHRNSKETQGHLSDVAIAMNCYDNTLRLLHFVNELFGTCIERVTEHEQVRACSGHILLIHVWHTSLAIQWKWMRQHRYGPHFVDEFLLYTSSKTHKINEAELIRATCCWFIVCKCL
jgi:hypothetical protein